MMRPVEWRQALVALALPFLVTFVCAALDRAQAQPVDSPAAVAIPALPAAPGYLPGQSPVFAPGFAVVTGFSGAIPAIPTPPPGVNPVDLLVIDPNGPSLRAVDGRTLGGPPRGQVVPVAKPLTVRAGDIGQVFAVALDDASPPNIYAAATSAYGLPIVVPDRNGDGVPDRVRQGQAGAFFMPGLFGPGAQLGPGTIWRIDGTTGLATIFATVTFDGTPNSGAALGGLAYDGASRLIYAADRESGTIHAFALDGREVARFDHGTDGLAALGLPPLPHNAARKLDITNPAFDSTDPATWNYAPPLRRTFGIATHRSRLYYAVAAGARIFSVGLAPDGTFTPNVRLEFAMPPSTVAGTEVSKIIFDDSGNMIVAERAPPTGAYDFGALTAEGAGRVLRLRAKPPGAGGTPFHWTDTGEYAIGFPGDHRNGDGGVAIGMGYDAAGYLNFAACGGTLWSTGSQLRITDNPGIGQRLAAGGPLPIDGLQGNAVTLVRPQNAPPFQSYFIDFDDIAEQAGTPGHMGDVVAWRACPGPLYPMVAELLFEEAFCPIGTYFGRNQCLPSPCRPGEFYRAGVCERPECVPDRRDPLCCPPGTKWNPRTQTCDRRPKQPDLTIKKEIIRCGTTACVFRLVVSNVGDAPYVGPIAVGDQITPGTVNSITPPSADWQCAPAGGNIFACINNNATLNPGQTLVFTVSVTIPPSLRGGWKNCAAVSGDRSKETNWSNNKSCVEREREQPKDPQKPNLTIVKTPGQCVRVRDGFICDFTITVTNQGPGDYTGEVVVNDQPNLPAGIRTIGGAGWTCSAGAAGVQTCRSPGGLRAGESKSIRVTVGVGMNSATSVTNCAAVNEPIRDGGLFTPRRTRLATSDVRDLLLRLAEGPLPPQTGGTPPGGGGIAPPQPPEAAPPSSQTRSCATISIPTESGTQTDSCPAGTVRTLRGGCCTPESIATGTCGTQTTETCTPPNVQVGNRCCTPTQMRDGTCGPPPPACQAPLVLYNDRCCNLREIQTGACGPPLPGCPPGLLRGPDGSCFPGTGIITDPIGCPPGTYRDPNGRCIPRTGIITDPVGCGPNQFRGDDGRCHNRPTTPGCGSGFVWDGRRCVKQPGSGTTKPSCSGGLVWDGSKCTRPGTKPTKPKPTKPTGPVKKPPSIGKPPGNWGGAKPPSTSRTIMPVRGGSAPPKMRR